MKNAYISYKKEPTLLPQSADAIVVGSGLGGLTTALELALKGFRVLILEQHSMPGGYAHSFSRKNYLFDVSLHHFGGLRPQHAVYKIFERLGVLDKLNFSAKKTLFSVQLPEFNLTVPNTENGFQETIIKIFPHEEENIHKLFELLKQLRQEIVDPWTIPNFVQETIPAISLYLNSSFGDIVSEFIKDPILKSVLAQFWTLIGLPPDRVTASFASCVFNSYFFEGSFDIKGGGTALVSAMIERLKELNSLCFTDAKVASIILDNNKKAVGVTLGDGKEIFAPIIISNASPHHLIDDLLPPDTIKPIFRHRLQSMTPSTSFFVTYLGLDCHPSTLGIPESTFFFNHHTDVEKAYQKALDGDIANTDWTMTSYENSTIVSHPSNGGIVIIVETVPGKKWTEMGDEEYKVEKQNAKDVLLRKYDKRFPGLKKHAVVHEFATPRTMKRYTGNHEGAIYGLAQLPSQSNSKRLRNIMPVPNLYLTGSWTWAGGGYEGAIMTGLQTAVSVFKHHKTKYNLDEYYKQSIQVYPRDVSSGGISLTSTLLKFMDRGRVDSGEKLLHIDGVESLFTNFNIQVYAIELNRLSDLHAGKIITLYSKYYKRTDLRAACHQVITKNDGTIVTDGMVELVRLNKENHLDIIPDVIDEQCPIPPLFPSLQPPKVPPKMRKKGFESTIRVYTEDSDLLGVTFHVNYFRFSHQSLFDFLSSNKNSDEKWTHWIYKKFHIRYLNSTHVGEDITISLVARKDGETLIVDQTITINKNGKVATQISFEPEFRDADGNVTPLPQALTAILGE